MEILLYRSRPHRSAAVGSVRVRRIASAHTDAAARRKMFDKSLKCGQFRTKIAEPREPKARRSTHVVVWLEFTQTLRCPIAIFPIRIYRRSRTRRPGAHSEALRRDRSAGERHSAVSPRAKKRKRHREKHMHAHTAARDRKTDESGAHNFRNEM